MTKRHLLSSTLLLALLASCGSTRVTVVGGQKDLGSDLGEFKVDHQSFVGLEVSSVPIGGGFGFEVGGHFGEDSGTSGGVDYDAETTEFYAGPRYEWQNGAWSPFLSGGLSLLGLRGSSSATPTSENEDDLGFYAAGGVDYRFNNGLFLGASVRGTFDQSFNVLGKEADASSLQGVLRFGYMF